MQLAKDCFDVGLMIDPSRFRLEDWSLGLGLELDCIIELEGLRQHRFHIGQAVLKVNVGIDPLPASAASGLTAFAVRGQRFELRDGAPIAVPADASTISSSSVGDGLDIEIASSSIEDSMRFYIEVLGLERVDGAAVRCGPGFILFRKTDERTSSGPLFGPGIRYLTFQVFDADAVCEHIEARGGATGRSPVDYGDVARYGFVLDPDGNWIEISARASVIAAYLN